MPGFKGHLFGAALIAGGTLGGLWHFGIYTPDKLTLFLLFTAAIIGSLFPDIDTDSVGRRLYYGSLIVADLILIYKKQYQTAALIGLCAMLPAADHHRGWTHTLWAMFLVPLPVPVLPIVFWNESWKNVMPYYLAFVFGYFTHLLLDREFRIKP